MLARLVVLALVACGGGTSQPAAEHAGHAHVESVPPEGKRFDPPVEKDAIPSGAWMCDMGTVHWAASEKNDGKCPICGMDLLQKK
ncbi:MAG: hypothetical protein H6736_07865 [Alphaproteobacteria bacterium]|nr:hypothetical protein [Alphaproteobacteria bacterium]